MTLLASTILSAPAMAQEKVAVRAGAHADYSRLVFDWPAATGYTVSKDASGQLTINFKTAATFDFSGVAPGKDTRIKSVTQADGTKVTVSLAPGMEYRHFMIGNRIILDVMGAGEKKMNTPPPAAAAQTAKKATPAPVPGAKAKPAPKVTPKTAEKTAAPTSITPPEKKPVEAVKSEPLPAEPVEVVEKEVIEAPEMKPHTISVSLTETVGMAAFRRGDALWLVFDRPEIGAPPAVTGPQQDSFPPFKRYEIKGGVAFRTSLPKGQDLNIYGEAGGLIWRVVVTPQERSVSPSKPARVFAGDGHGARGGTMFWPMTQPARLLELPDPDVGDLVQVVTVPDATRLTGPEQSFVDFTALPAAVGMALVPKVDNLEVKLAPSGVTVMRPGGLALSGEEDIGRRLIRQEVTEATVQVPATTDQKIKRIFDFDRWMMGGIQALNQNQKILMSTMVSKDQSGRVQDLLTLAKMSLANDRGQEAIGFLSYAEQEMPGITEGAEFRALRGAAYALSGKYELAMQDFNYPGLKDYTEADYWRAYTLAWLEDWQQAQSVMPKEYSVLVGYPLQLLEKVGLKLAEVSLRNGDVVAANAILDVLQRNKEKLKPWTAAGADYLRGEAHRQKGELDKAREWWEPLIKGSDDLYRVKAGLAITLLELQKGDIDRAQAIDRLEALRYVWRGDELEARINYILGTMYLEDKRYTKGFGILREAAGMSPDSDVGHEIIADMRDRYKRLLLEDETISPLDAVTVYEEFRDMAPSGDEGNKIVQKLAERLVKADLLDRASNILQHQVDKMLEGEERARVAMRLAAIYLLDDRADKAVPALDVAKSLYEATPESPNRKLQLYKIELMRARALSQMDRTQEALALLSKFEPTGDVNRLRADIAWQAGLWDEAAAALEDLILDEALDPAQVLSQKQADLILNRAVALNLSGNRVALVNIRKRYLDAMNKTSRSKLFDVVTRPRQGTVLADRETLQAIVSEVDIFKDFLESFRSAEETEAVPVETPAPAPAAVPPAAAQ